MSARGHLRLFLAAAAAWVGFFVAGLPGYYQQYSTGALVAFEVLLLGPIWAAGYFALRRRARLSRMRRAVAISFHFTVPLFLYDVLYCGVHLGLGAAFLVRYWYLTTYYVVPWVLFPATARWLDSREAVRLPPPARPERSRAAGAVSSRPGGNH